jgi:endonuclease/exonuclease/phosphatase family metal-dependent hydrolase
VKVITYNLHKGVGRARQSILEAAIAAIAERAPDLVLCQEVFHGAREAVLQCAHISETLGLSHVFGPNVFRPQGCYGNATFSRLQAARFVNVDITQSMIERRGMLRTWFAGEHGPFEVLNVHFSLTGRQRRRQWERLLEALPADLDVPVVAGGDFNDWSGALDRRARRIPGLRNVLWELPARARRSFPARRPMLPLDRIYVRGFAVREVRVLHGPPWDQLSDHLPLETILEPRQPG